MNRPLPPDAVELLAVHVPRENLERVLVVTGRPWRWLPWLLGTGAVTIGSRVVFRDGRFRTDTAKGLALIAHEAMHTQQCRELGLPGFMGRYLVGQFRCGFNHDQHPMERDFVALQRRVREALRGAGLPDS